MLRNYSRETLRPFVRQAGPTRAASTEKRGAVVKESEVVVGKYKYDTREELGRGYSSSVYKGVEVLRSHKRYAIKVIPLSKFRADSRCLLESEVEIQLALDHPHIVKLHEVIRTPTTYYLVLDYCPHGSLSEHIAHKQTLPETAAAEIMAQLLSAYRHLLAEGILHRDIKPANILRVGKIWKLSDFGFAVRARVGFKDRVSVGTPLYLAPQALRRSMYSYKSDFYALGVVLFEMVVGKPPLQVRTEEELREKIGGEINLPAGIRHPRVIEFVGKVCLPSEAKRMNREEFESFDFGDAVSTPAPSMLHSQSSFSLKSRKFSGITEDSLTKPHDSLPSKVHDSISKPYDSQQRRFNRNPLIANHEMLSLELQYAQLCHSAVKNITSFLIPDTTKSLLTLALFKLALKILRQLCDRSQNPFQLPHWEDYSSCKLHQELLIKTQAVSQDYEQQFLELIRSLDAKAIRAANRKFPELANELPLTCKFYLTLRQFLAMVVREHSQEVSTLVNKGEETLTDRFEAQYCVHALYKLAEMRSHTVTAAGEKLNVLEDYSESKRTRTDFMGLRKAVKSIE